MHNPGPAWLFCPADRPERFEKAAAAADVVILDLEDGWRRAIETTLGPRSSTFSSIPHAPWCASTHSAPTTNPATSRLWHAHATTP
ncbi:citrate lyase subunit beta-like domain protein [Mycobacterium xenopi 3993]|nr:citrate lyase subunit beta-like domain protein [Mycobacterium xenopi 3993]